MYYTAKALEICPNDYEGTVILEIRGEKLRCSYMAPADFAAAYLKRGDAVMADLWLAYAEDTLKIVPAGEPSFGRDLMIAGGEIRGRIETILSSASLRINCGKLMFDIKVGDTAPFLEQAYVRATGTYTVFFPNTAYSYQEIG